MTRPSLRELTRTALAPERPGSAGDLARVIARATGSAGAVLWAAPEELCGDPTLSVLAAGLPGWAGPSPAPERADPVSTAAHASRSLALGPGGAVFGHRVRAAVPVDYLDGTTGVLALLGDGELGPEEFDAVAEIVEVLPELCGAVRERQTLDLANACSSILHDADAESPDAPLTRERLGAHLSEVCEHVARVLSCPDVAVYLRDPATPEDGWRWLGGTAGPASDPLAGEPADVLRSGIGAGGGPLMDVRLVGGPQLDGADGLLRCRGSSGPPHHFTASDFAVVRPVAAQVARYWRGWLRRRALSKENETWRALAAGMTSLNEMFVEQLRATPTAKDAVDAVQDVTALATRLVRDVVPGATQAQVVPDGAGADATTNGVGWLRRTRIQVGAQQYGVLEGAGEGAEPASSEQVHRILADQLGLHRHLHDALAERRRAERALAEVVRTQAEAMEDLKHQLVSPLRAAVTRTEKVLLSRGPDARTDSQLKAVRGLCRKAERVAMSAGVFVALGRGTRPSPRTETFGREDLLRMLVLAAADVEALADPGRGLSFDVDRRSGDVIGRRFVRADGSFLQQCLGNVLDNAVKYSYDGTRVGVALVADRAGAGVAVTSTGIPMSTAELARCRERNWRGDHARYTTGEGSGIGLWIVDNLMLAMRGRLDVAATGDRTTIRLLLPAT